MEGVGIFCRDRESSGVQTGHQLCAWLGEHGILHRIEEETETSSRSAKSIPWREQLSALKRTSPSFVFRLAQGHFQLVRLPDAVNQLAVMTALLPLFYCFAFDSA